MGKPARYELTQIQGAETEDGDALELRCQARSGHGVVVVLDWSMARALAQLLLAHVEPGR